MYLDQKDSAIYETRNKWYQEQSKPTVGDFIRYPNGKYERISYVWPDKAQTTDDGSFYLGDGYVSYSGGLFSGVKTNTLSLNNNEKQLGRFWFFHHNDRKAHNSVECILKCRVWNTTAQ